MKNAKGHPSRYQAKIGLNMQARLQKSTLFILTHVCHPVFDPLKASVRISQTFCTKTEVGPGAPFLTLKICLYFQEQSVGAVQ
jgi:hypothetical protein